MADNITEKPTEEKPFEIKLREEYKDKEVFEGKTVDELEKENAELLNANQNLEELSIRDPLTGLNNRRRMDADFDDIQPDEEFATLFIDVDNLKKINDNFGHEAGDEVLKKTANSILANVRSDTDSVYRSGGEEFVVLIKGKLTLQKLREIAEIIREAVSKNEHRRLGKSEQVSVTVSIGGALRNEDTRKPSDVLKSADDAMYRAKKSGKNKVVLDGEKQGITNKTASTVTDNGSQGNNNGFTL